MKNVISFLIPTLQNHFNIRKKTWFKYHFLFAKNIKHCKTPIFQMKNPFESVRTWFLIFVRVCLNLKTLF
jgi:hypothetical protein